MLRICLSAIIGAVACSLLPGLPAHQWLWWLLLPATLATRWRAGRVYAACLLGFAGFGLSAGAAMDQQLASSLHRKKISFTAEVIDFPKYTEGHLVLLVRPADALLPGRIRLSWYRSKVRPRLGEHWQFEAKLRRPRGSRNPGGFDYEAWLHRARIGASGYVVTARHLQVPAQGLSAIRRQLAERIVDLLPAGEARAALLAISIGARQDLSAASWERYAITGTSHLMAISGLHIGLATFGATLLLWGIAGVMRPRGNLRTRSLLLALPVPLLYAAVSGFAVPSQRALLMTLCAACALLLRRAPRPLEWLVVIAVVVLLLDPLALLAPGFLLSFGAVAILLQLARYRAPRSASGAKSSSSLAVAELIPLQCGLLLGLFPAVAFLFARSAWLGPLSNLLILPLFSMITVPAALLGLLLGGPLAALGDLLLWLAWYSLQAAHWLISQLAELPGARINLSSVAGIATTLLLLPVLWVLVPSGFPGRHLALLSLVAAFLYRPPLVPNNCVDVHTLDVGQGLATVVQTRRHTLLYDTGPAYAGGSSAARVVLPFLERLGVSALDVLMISHADQDHAGGVATLLNKVPVTRLLSGERLDAPGTHALCARGQHWDWDGVLFDVLHPRQGTLRDGNNSSCVLRIRAGQTKLLLTGDIEARVERELVEARSAGEVDFTLVPHHGSRTSSTAAFVGHLRARVAVVSAGFENRWGFPKDDVIARWAAAGTRVLNTATSGAISYRACAPDNLTLLGEYRKQVRRYWHHDED